MDHINLGLGLKDLVILHSCGSSDHCIRPYFRGFGDYGSGSDMGGLLPTLREIRHW